MKTPSIISLGLIMLASGAGIPTAAAAQSVAIDASKHPTNLRVIARRQLTPLSLGLPYRGKSTATTRRGPASRRLRPASRARIARKEILSTYQEDTQLLAAAPALKPVPRRNSTAQDIRQASGEQRVAQAAPAPRQQQSPSPQAQPTRGRSQVVNELDRMFRENGGQMPPMTPSQLPNAHLSGAVRPKQNPPPQAGKKPSGLLGKLFSRFRRESAPKDDNIEYTKAPQGQAPPAPPVRYPTQQNAAAQNRIPANSGQPRLNSQSRVSSRPQQQGMIRGASNRNPQPAISPATRSVQQPQQRVPVAIQPAPAVEDEFKMPIRRKQTAEPVETPDVPPADDFESPFTDQSEAEADDGSTASNSLDVSETDDELDLSLEPEAPAEEPAEQPEPAAEPSPFTGVKLSPTPKPAPAPPAAPPRIRKKTPTDVSSKRQLIAQRSGLTGFKGFCPVALRDQRDLVDTLPEHNATFGLKTYYFSSSAAREEFVRNPARYAPAANGVDIVLLTNTGEEIEGNIEFASWYKGRLFMFSSRDTMEAFTASPTNFTHAN